MARVLLRRPALVILDEATSAVGDATAAALYERIRVTGAAVLSFSQCGSALRSHHDAVIVLSGRSKGGVGSGGSQHIDTAEGSWHWLAGERTADLL